MYVTMPKVQRVLHFIYITCSIIALAKKLIRHLAASLIEELAQEGT